LLTTAHRFTLALIVCAASLLGLAGVASAKPIYHYSVEIRDASDSGTQSASIEVRPLNVLQSTTVRVVRGGVEQIRTSVSAGGSYIDVSFATLTAGDVVEVYQPGIPAGPPAILPTETFTIPAAGLASTPGATSMSGFAPDGTIEVVHYSPVCFDGPRDDITAIPSGGHFSVPVPLPVPAGLRTRLTVYPGQGDWVTFESRVDGESPCLYMNGSAPDLAPGVIANSEPYQYYVENLRPGAITSTRVVFSRGGVSYLDKTRPTTTEFSDTTAATPLGGDRVDVYRPAAAATPTYSFTLPVATAKFDPATNQIAVDTAAARRVSVRVFRTFGSIYTGRSVAPVAAGRLLFNMGQASADQPAVTLRSTDRLDMSIVNPAGNILFYTGGGLGDLLAPSVRLKPSKHLKLSKLGKKLKLKLSSTEAGRATITMALPKSLPSKSKPRPKKSKRKLVIAKFTGNIAVGSSTVTLKFNKAGLRALKQLSSSGSDIVESVSFSLVVTDAAGNVGSATKTSKLVLR
jgi:hypothetical protein